MGVNVLQLHKELEAAGLPVSGVSADGRVDYSRTLTAPETATANAVIAAHVPRDFEGIRREAEGQVAAIPNWATWTEQQVIEYINTNVTTLASAKVVLVALARMVVALRNETWPGLQQ